MNIVEIERSPEEWGTGSLDWKVLYDKELQMFSVEIGTDADVIHRCDKLKEVYAFLLGYQRGLGG